MQRRHESPHPDESPSAPRVDGRSRDPARPHRRTATFPLVFALTLFALMALGFARSFFLRPWFDTYDVATYVLWHGVAMTAWFAWLVLQTALVAMGRSRWHRAAGWWGVGVGVLAVVSAAAVNWAMVVRARRAGRDVRGALDTWADVLWSNGAPLIVFAALFLAAVALRRRPLAHAPLMLLASVAMLDPALARIGVLPATEIAGRTLDQWVFPIGMMILLPALVLAWDRRRLRRFQFTTLAGTAAVWFAIPALRWIGTTTLGQTVVGWWL